MSTSPYKLQLTNGFFADFGQIARMLAYAVARRDDGRIPPEACATSIGISASRVKNLSSLAAAFELIRPVVLTPTELGSAIHRHDPFLDEVGTLWLLHYRMSSNERYVVWNRLVNRVIPENDRFSTAIARPYFDDLSPFYSERSMDKHLRKEMGAVWNAYTGQALRHLGYLRAESADATGTDEKESEPWCPYCGQTAPRDKWWTQEQIAYIHVFAYNIMAQIVNEQLIRPMKREFSGRRTGFVSIKFDGR